MRSPKKPVVVTQGPSPIPGNSGNGQPHPNIPQARDDHSVRVTHETFQNPVGQRRPRAIRSFVERHGGQ